MHYAILAAGEGSRIAQESNGYPKPLIEIQGVPMIHRLLLIMLSCKAESITVVVNAKMPEVVQYVDWFAQQVQTPIYIKVRLTPSSMHTFLELRDSIPAGKRFIATTVDTIFRPDDFLRYAEAFASAHDNIDGMMAVTPFVDDEKPLWVACDTHNDIIGFYDERNADTHFVSGGIYGLDTRAFDVAQACIDRGESRMRNFQRALISEGFAIKAYPIDKIIDVDHVDDIAKAEAFLSEGQPADEAPVS